MSVSNVDTKKIWVWVSVADFMTPEILVSVSDVRDTRNTSVGVGFFDTRNFGVGVSVGRSRHRTGFSVTVKSIGLGVA